MKKLLKNLIIGLAYIFTTILVLNALVISYTSIKEILFPEEIIIPDPNIGISNSSSTSSSPVIKKTSILNDAYIPPYNPFSTANYSLIPKVLFFGDFNDISMLINGDIIGDGERILMLNVGEKTGLINGFRKNKNSYNLAKMKENNGIFSKENPIKLNLDFLKMQLGTSSKEYNGLNETVPLDFASNFNTPYVTKIGVIPLKTSGEYGGAIINTISLIYTCNNDSKCNIGTCNNDESDYNCVKRIYDKEIADKWCKSVSYCTI